MEQLSQHVMYDGGERSPISRQVLRAGPLTLALEGADLRYIRLGDREALRRVYVAVRDHNWDTILPVLSNVRANVAADSFDISFDVEHRADTVDFSWHGTITGSADGTVTYVMDGEARATFMKNRIGICVLHPMDCAGLPCAVLKTGGSLEQNTFPRYIAPHQPFLDFQALTHEVLPGVRAEVRLDGDIFEIEDQRNWTDASFKTYSTPLRLPYPVEVRTGTRIRQSFRLSLQGAAPPLASDDQDAIAFDIDPAVSYPLPRLGLGMASHGQPLSDRELAWLRPLRLAHLRVDLDLSSPHYENALARATHDAGRLGVPLEVALILSGNAATELADLAEALGRHRPEVAAWLIFHRDEKSTAARWIALARRALGSYGAAIPLGGGTNAYFAELNRGRPPLEALDLVSYSVNPQVHAFDNASLTENLAAQAAALESARQFCSDKPLAVSPVTLKPRFNPNATGPQPTPPPGTLPDPVDPRQMSLFGAGWTAGSIKYLAQGGAARVTYYETTGWRGVMESEAGPLLPDRFHSQTGMLFPLYHVLADVGELAGAVTLKSVSSHPLQVEGLVLRDGARIRVLLANMTDRERAVRLSIPGIETVRIRRLDERSFARATGDGAAFRAEPDEEQAAPDGGLEVTLLPYAVVRIDSGDRSG